MYILEKINYGKIYEILLSKSASDSGISSFNSSRLDSGLDVSTTTFHYALDTVKIREIFFHNLEKNLF